MSAVPWIGRFCHSVNMFFFSCDTVNTQKECSINEQSYLAIYIMAIVYVLYITYILCSLNTGMICFF